MALTDARDALSQDRIEDALDVLLDAWRSTRAPAIADLIDVLSDDVTRTLPPIDGKTRNAFQEAWIDVAGGARSVDVGRLLATFEREPCTQILARLARFEARPHDPRIARALFGMVARCPCTSNPNFPMWTRLFKLLVAIGDVRMRDVLKARLTPRIHGSFYEVLYPRIEKALAGLQDPPPLSPDDASLVAELSLRARERLAAPPKAIVRAAEDGKAKKNAVSGGELLRLVLEEPESDAPRLVYADWLLEQGDPRGDFVSLQFKRAEGGLSRAEAKREKALLAKHEREWLGAIEPVVYQDGVRFERGFVVACSANFRTKRQRETLVTHPHWSTVREIGGAPYELLVDDSMRALRVATGLDQAVLARLAHAPKALPLEEIGFALGEAGPEQKLIGRAITLPNLRRVTVVLPAIGYTAPPPVLPSEVDWLLTSELGTQIEALTILGSAKWSSFQAARPDLGAWLEALRPLPRLTSLTFDVQFNWGLTITRASGGTWALDLRAYDPSDRGTLEPILRGVPRNTFTRFTLLTNAPPGTMEELKRLLGLSMMA